MNDYNEKDRANEGELNLPTPISTRRRRVKTFKEFMGSKGRPQSRNFIRLRGANYQPDAAAELQQTTAATRQLKAMTT
jgi:hypothetical protein